MMSYIMDKFRMVTKKRNEYIPDVIYNNNESTEVQTLGVIRIQL